MENDKIIKIFFVILAMVFFVPVIAMFKTFLPSFEWNPTIVLLILVGLVVVWIITTYNKFVFLSQKVKQAQSGIDVYLKQRFDLIPNLVETVKGYKEYEENLMTSITKLREDYKNRNDQDILQSQELNDRYTRLLMVIENYPELKASEAFLKLQKTLSKIESQLQAARRIYNSEVTEYNTKLYKFPSNLIAKVTGFKEKSLFQIVESERENIKVNV